MVMETVAYVSRAGTFRLLKLNAERVIDELVKSIYD